MKSKYFRPQLLGTVMIFVLIFSVLGVVQNQVIPVSAQGPGGMTVVRDYKHDVSPPVRNIRPLPLPQIPEHEENAPIQIGRHQDQPDSIVQNYLATPAMPGTDLNFDGIPFPGVDCNCAPPDTNGEVGLTQYVQIVNEGFQVFRKRDGSSAFGPVGISTLWSGFGGVCQTNGVGDPVVLYDQIADRWVISQFAGKHVPTDECIAVSTTSDATGSYYRYGFHLGNSFFDYPKLGVWPDAYYMSMNVFNTGGTAFLGPQPFAFDRAAMLDGNSATYITPGITGGSSEETYLPSDLDGSTLPPAGAPNTFVEWPNGGVYKVFHFHVDFATPGNSSFTLFATPPAAGFTALCLSTRACVPEPNGSALDALADRFMFRLAYRNFGDHESVVTNYTVSSGGVAGIRWIELRDVTNGPVTVHQESTYQPDNTWRWLGSAAMDRYGNLAIGFSASSSSVYPSIRYAGRLADDPLNTLGQGESVLFAGLGSQTGTSNRWGDYSDLTVDPEDDCTFWYTNEYYPSGSSQFNWRTRIGSFKFADCGGDTPPTVSITSPSNGATVSGSVTVTADASDDNGVTQVEFKVNGSIIGTDTDGTDGWTASWDTTAYSDDAYTVSATATDTIEQTGSDSIGVTVQNTTADNPPTVSITNPSNGATVSDTVNVTATASDDNGVTKVEFKVNGSTIGTDTDGTDGWSTSWDTTAYSDDAYTVSATATDTIGQTSSDSIGVTVQNTVPSGTMHVSAIAMSYVQHGPNYTVYIQISIVDENGSPVSGATVDLSLDVPGGGTATGSAATGSDGTVTFSYKSKNTGTYGATVTNVSHSSYTYDPGANVVTSASLQVP